MAIRLPLPCNRRDRDGNLVETATDPATQPLKVAKILPMTGLAADRALVPTFKGMTDVDRVANWRPPPGLKIDTALADEPYWDAHRAAPKIILSPAAAKSLWQESAAETGVRIPADKAAAFAAALRDELRPTDVGMQVLPIRDLQLTAARGSTDFSGLFIGFSFFLVASAMIILAAAPSHEH